jgi:hypothetical protein
VIVNRSRVAVLMALAIICAGGSEASAAAPTAQGATGLPDISHVVVTNVSTATRRIQDGSERDVVRSSAARRAERRAKLRQMRADPPRNVTAAPNYGSCWTARRSPNCTRLELASINHARAAEGVRRMKLPADFSQLSNAEQTFVVTNLERTARGLRPFVALVPQLDARASVAARKNVDPSLTSWHVGRAQAWKWVSNWADDINPLAADYDYMYNDGYSKSGTINGACTSTHPSGCWAHRHNILEHYPRLPLLIAGAAEIRRGALESSTIIMVGARGRSPHAAFTWRQAKDSSITS